MGAALDLRRLAPALVLALVAVACSGQGGGRPAGTADGNELVAQVASYDLAAGSEERFLLGLLTKDGKPLNGGTANMRFFYLGRERASKKAMPGPQATGRFLPIPKEKGGHGAGAHDELPEGFGVYAANVRFDRAGLWEVEVTPEAEGRAGGRGRASFEVLEEHKVPAVGDEAPRSENLTLASTEAPKGAIDSRAATEGSIPDPELHAIMIKGALEQRRPVLVVFSTPVYCVSRFCGPITDLVAQLASEYSDRAAFIHVEIWRDREGDEINQAAAEWLYRDGDLQEPWVFLIGADGRIAARWGNVATREEIEPLLRQLPPQR